MSLFIALRERVRSLIGRRVYDRLLGIYKYFVKPIRCRRLQLHGLEVLGLMNKILVENSIEYCIAYGTLLGFVREGGFLRHDDDIDLFVNINDVSDMAHTVRLIEEGGFVFKHVLMFRDKVLYYTFEHKGISVDLFSYSKDAANDKLYTYSVYTDTDAHYEDINQNGWCTITLPLIKGFVLETKDKINYMVPSNGEQLLEAYYGKSWRCPDPKWVDDDAASCTEKMQGFAVRICDRSDFCHNVE